jgi:hypothetical protein
VTYARHALTQWTFYEGQSRIGETLAPSFKDRSTLTIVDAEIGQGASGVLFAVGGISPGFAVFLDNDTTPTMNRYKVKSDRPIATGASETFDVGEDLGSSVSLDNADRAPFKLTGKIEKSEREIHWPALD